MRRWTALSLLISCMLTWSPSFAGTARLKSKDCADVIRKILTISEEEISYGGVTFKLATLNGKSFFPVRPSPKLARGFDQRSPIARDLDSKWDLRKFNQARAPLQLESVRDPQSFGTRRDLRILDLPIKMAGSNEYRVPEELAQFRDVIQQIVDHEHAMMGEEKLKKYYAYITIDQGWVEPGKTQRKPGNHVDGFQGARIVEKNEINHSYIASNGTPTVFYDQPFDFSHLDEAKHDFFREMDRVADERNSLRTKPNTIYLMDAYSVHRADLAPQRTYRTFFRLSYDVKEFDRLGNTINPHFDYQWNMIARDVHSTLQEYKPMEACRRCGMCARGRAFQEQEGEGVGAFISRPGKSSTAPPAPRFIPLKPAGK